jgi:hypothetical protein
MNAKIITAAAALEAIVGVVLIVDPSAASSLLFGDALSGLGAVVGRVAGFGLFGLGLAAWPGAQTSNLSSAARGLFAYNALAAIFFLYLGVRGEFVGPFLWPAFAVHAALAGLLARVFTVGAAGK